MKEMRLTELSVQQRLQNLHKKNNWQAAKLIDSAHDIKTENFKTDINDNLVDDLQTGINDMLRMEVGMRP